MTNDLYVSARQGRFSLGAIFDTPAPKPDLRLITGGKLAAPNANLKVPAVARVTQAKEAA